MELCPSVCIFGKPVHTDTQRQTHIPSCPGFRELQENVAYHQHIALAVSRLPALSNGWLTHKWEIMPLCECARAYVRRVARCVCVVCVVCVPLPSHQERSLGTGYY